jgi:peptidoglycan/LPS O-acetylase OafA/YrhL
MVVWSHAFALYFGTERSEPIAMALNGRTNAGELAVRLFFVISGYLIVRSALSSASVADFLSKRIRRVYPGFLASTAICTFVVVPLFATSGFALITPAAVWNWAWRGLLLQEVIPGADAFSGNPLQAVNGALWSVRYEFWFYLCVAAMSFARLLPRKELILGLLAISIAAKAGLDLMERKPGGGALEVVIGWPYAWFTMGPYFLAGMAAHFYGPLLRRSRALLLVMLVALLGAAQFDGSARIIFDMLCPFVLTYALFQAAYPGSERLAGIRRLGDVSYGIYLYGFPIQQMILATFHPSFAIYVIGCLACSMVAGWLSWNLVESRFIRRGSAPSRVTVARPLGMYPAMES